MKLTCAGTGTAAPGRPCSGYWVESRAGTRLLLDCGPGVVHALANQGLPWPQLDALLLTHFHNDHTGDVPFLLFALHYGVREPRGAPLDVVGPTGTRKLFQRLGSAFGRHVARPRFEVRFRELAGGHAIELGGIRVRAEVTPHTNASLAFRLEADGQAFGYTGDTGESPELAEFMKGVDVLVAECSLPESEALESHLTPERLARMAAVAQPGVLVPTHLYPQLDAAGLPEALRAAGWAGRTVVAREGLVVPERAAQTSPEQG